MTSPLPEISVAETLARKIVDAHAAALGSLSEDDQDWFFARTAETLFRLDLGHEGGAERLDVP